MLLLGLLLLTSALAGQRTGTRAESNLSSKLQLSSDKEQNGESRPLLPPSRFSPCVLVGIVRWRVGSFLQPWS